MITTSSVLLTIALIALLVPRVLLNGLSNPIAARIRLALNVALVPLTLMFLASVVAVITNGSGEPTVASGAAPTVDSSATAPPAPTAGATATPAGVPSPQPGAERLLADTFDSTASGWIERRAPDWNAGYDSGRYQITLTGRPTVNISTPLPAEAYQLSADVMLDQGDAGLVFLSIEPAMFYRLLIRDDGTYTLQSVDQANKNAVSSVIAWTASGAINTGADAVNRLRIERLGNTVRLFANNQPLNAFTVPAGEYQNQYGFALAATQGGGRATFDNLLIERRAGS